MNEGPYDYSQEANAPSTHQGNASKPQKPFRLLPTWWWVLVIVLVAGSFLVATVERAASQLILNATIFLAILIPLVRYCIWGKRRLAIRALPLLGFLGALAAAGSTLRVDDMDGNLIPRRVSFRWQKQRDEMLEVPQATGGEGIDLMTTTEQDFPQFLGPNGDGSVPAASFATDWEANPPQQIWLHEEFGAGWSGFVAVNGYAVTLEQRGENEITSCYEIKTGELMWSHAETARHLTVPGGIGPRSTPSIYEGKVYSLGATGILCCLDGASGELLWKKNLQEEIGTTPEEEKERIAWGRSNSPLLDDGRVIVPLGMPNGASLIAFDASTGNELWRKGERQLSYASPKIATLDGVRQIVVVCESQVCGHDASTGDELWEFEWGGSSNGNASCSQPIDLGDSRMLFSKGYAHGAALVEIKQSEGKWTVKELWQSSRVLRTKFTNAVTHEGHVYALNDGIFSCVDAETGKQRWKRGRYGHGQVLKTNSGLLVQTETGDVVLLALNPKRSEELARFSPIEGKTWNNPCLYGNYLLVRNGEQAACYLLQE